MPDPSIVNPGESSYKLPQPTTTPVGDVPQMDMDRVLPRQQSTGLARGVQQFGSPNLFADSGNNQIIVSKTDNTVTTNQVLMGNQPNFGEGFYVSKPNIDVTTAKNPADFIFNSNQNTLKIVQSDVARFYIPSDPVTVATIKHKLGFAPIPFAYFNGVGITGVGNTGINLPLPTWTGATIDTVAGYVKFLTWVDCASDDQNLYIQCLNSTGAALGVFSFTYYLTQESAKI